MAFDFAAAMRQAAEFTRGGDISTATRIIQNALAGGNSPEAPDSPPSSHRESGHSRLGGSDKESVKEVAPSTVSGIPETAPSRGRPRRPLAEVIRLLREARARVGTIAPRPGITGLKTSQPPPIPDGAQFLDRSFTSAAGTRSYKLYIPASAPERPCALVVMLHGCKQSPADFAAGTKMNRIAELHGLIVAYPAQTGAANMSSCWNWFNPADQMRDAGEPSIIAGTTREIMREFGLGPHQVFVAGLSAGGAMAAVMGVTYPDLYAAVGIHSGLAYKSANDVISAFAAMRGAAGPALEPEPRYQAGMKPHPRTIIFQGTADQVVNASNAARIVEAVSRDVPRANATRDRDGFAGGRTFNRLIVEQADGGPFLECWLIEGAGHAWSGGDPAGSFTDPSGPDASAELVRFFLTERPPG
jgi:poly(hydroxyalkanoate) depolymerase family esterase